MLYLVVVFGKEINILKQLRISYDLPLKDNSNFGITDFKS